MSYNEEDYWGEVQAGEHASPPPPEAKPDWLVAIQIEADRGRSLHGLFNSRHEAYAVMLEEVDELWAEIKSNNGRPATIEAVQVAAMALRFLEEFGE